MARDSGWSREYLFQLVDNVREYAIFVSDLNGTIVSWNVGASLIFGYDPEEAIGMDSRLLFTPEDRAAEIPEKELATAREKGQADDERWHIRKNGTRFFASGIQTALYNESQELTGYAKIARDLTERVRFQDELAEAQSLLETRVEERTEELARANESLRLEVVSRRQSEELRVALLRKIVNTQENERKRISREIHDTIGQQLTALKFKLNHIISQPSSDPEMTAAFSEIQSIADRIDAEVDFLAWELRPSVIDDLGLSAALQKFVREWSEHFQVPAEFSAIGQNIPRLLPEIAINLYRIAQEALNNVAKHAEANAASTLLEIREEDVVLIVEDDGQGFDLKAKVAVSANGRGMGLLGMKERAELVGGSIEIESAPGSGTTVFARIPARYDADGKPVPARSSPTPMRF